MRQNPNELIKRLFDKGFFSKYRELSEILKELLDLGFRMSKAPVSVALLRLVRYDNPILERKNIDGKWKYVQKEVHMSKNKIKLSSFENQNLHTQIKKVSQNQFKSKDYKGAIQNAFVEVIHQIKVKTNHPKTNEGKDLDGDDLVNKVFGCENAHIPMIKVNDLKTSLDRAEQKGVMYLFKGVVGIRDKKAHLNFIQKDPIKTLEYLSLASLLMRILDENPMVVS